MSKLSERFHNLRPIELGAHPQPAELDDLASSLESVSDETAFYANVTETCWMGGIDGDSPWEPPLIPYMRLDNYKMLRKIEGTQASIARKAVFSLDYAMFAKSKEGKAIVSLENRTDQNSWRYCFIPELVYDQEDLMNLRGHALEFAIEGLRRLVNADKSDFALSGLLEDHVRKIG